MIVHRSCCGPFFVAFSDATAVLHRRRPPTATDRPVSYPCNRVHRLVQGPPTEWKAAMMRNVGILSLLAASYLTGLVAVDLLDSGDPDTKRLTGWHQEPAQQTSTHDGGIQHAPSRFPNGKLD